MGHQEIETKDETSAESFWQEFMPYFLGAVNRGQSKEEIIKHLEDLGIEEKDASVIYETAASALYNSEKANRPTIGRIAGALIGAAVTVILGGLLWGQIVLWTDYEVGFMAVGIGLLAGYSVLLMSGKQRGAIYQIIAVLASLAGMFIGKYYMFYGLAKKALAEQGDEAVSILSGQAMSTFTSNLSSVYDGFDFLWILLAVASAVTIPQRQWSLSRKAIKNLEVKPTPVVIESDTIDSKNFCTHCGKAIESNAVFCTHCGTKVEN